jgi:hypothetical protein
LRKAKIPVLMLAKKERVASAWRSILVQVVKILLTRAEREAKERELTSLK